MVKIRISKILHTGAEQNPSGSINGFYVNGTSKYFVVKTDERIEEKFDYDFTFPRNFGQIFIDVDKLNSIVYKHITSGENETTSTIKFKTDSKSTFNQYEIIRNYGLVTEFCGNLKDKYKQKEYFNEEIITVTSNEVIVDLLPEHTVYFRVRSIYRRRA